MTRRKRIIRTVVMGLLLLMIINFAVSMTIYYHADETALQYMQSGGGVTVTQTQYGWLFDGPSEDSALIFYPGAKVEETAYAPLLHKLAAEDMDVCLVKMPLHIATLHGNAAKDIEEMYDSKNWYISGHSLGGAVAALFAAKNPDLFSGLILLAAYPTKNLPASMPVMVLVGSEDHVINWNKINASAQYVSGDYTEYVIEGGNHAQFGSYGNQKGDGTALITSDEQIRETVSVIHDHLPEAW